MNSSLTTLSRCFQMSLWTLDYLNCRVFFFRNSKHFDCCNCSLASSTSKIFPELTISAPKSWKVVIERGRQSRNSRLWTNKTRWQRLFAGIFHWRRHRWRWWASSTRNWRNMLSRTSLHFFVARYFEPFLYIELVRGNWRRCLVLRWMVKDLDEQWARWTRREWSEEWRTR